MDTTRTSIPCLLFAGLTVIAPMAMAQELGSSQTPALASAELGKDFTNSEGISMDYRARSDAGNPFWRSVSAPLAGRTVAAATKHCLGLTKKERKAGIIPEGYVYQPSVKKDGRYVLMKSSELTSAGAPLAIAADKAGFYYSPHARNKAPIDLSDGATYPFGILLTCPFTGKVFRKP